MRDPASGRARDIKSRPEAVAGCSASWRSFVQLGQQVDGSCDRSAKSICGTCHALLQLMSSSPYWPAIMPQLTRAEFSKLCSAVIGWRVQRPAHHETLRVYSPAQLLRKPSWGFPRHFVTAARSMAHYRPFILSRCQEGSSACPVGEVAIFTKPLLPSRPAAYTEAPPLPIEIAPTRSVSSSFSSALSFSVSLTPPFPQPLTSEGAVAPSLDLSPPLFHLSFLPFPMPFLPYPL